jgi:hypothetical protein
MTSVCASLRLGGSATLNSLALACILATSPAQAETTLRDAIAGGMPIIDIRLREETVDQANKPKNAIATTMRARLGYQTGQYYGFSALADFDFLQHVGPKRYFDTKGGTPSSLYPTIPDPDMVALNRLQLSYGRRILDSAPGMGPDLRITLGRQRLIFGDQRFVGNVGWRQHEQTFDSVSVVDTSLPATTLTYAYVTRINRVFGPDSPMGRFDSHTHVFDATYTGLMPYLKLEGYALLLDLRQAPTLSTETFGVRGEGAYDFGSGFTGILNGAYARQTDSAKNPLSYALSYYLGEGGLNYRGASAVAGYEVLEGNGTVGFSTPLATLHIFQGWADVFLTTPTNGIKDLYLKSAYGFGVAPVFNRVTATILYHDFRAERGSAYYGSEWDAQIEGAVDANVTVGVKYAAFHGSAPFASKNVSWLYVGYRY